MGGSIASVVPGREVGKKTLAGWRDGEFAPEYFATINAEPNSVPFQALFPGSFFGEFKVNPK